MPKKIKASWKPGSEFLPPFTIKESVNNLLYGDKLLGEGKMTYDEAEKLVIEYRKNNQEFKND